MDYPTISVASLEGRTNNKKTAELKTPIAASQPNCVFERLRTRQTGCIGWSVNAEKQAVFISGEVEAWKSIKAPSMPVTSLKMIY